MYANPRYLLKIDPKWTLGGLATIDFQPSQTADPESIFDRFSSVTVHSFFNNLMTILTPPMESENQSRRAVIELRCETPNRIGYRIFEPESCDRSFLFELVLTRGACSERAGHAFRVDSPPVGKGLSKSIVFSILFSDFPPIRPLQKFGRQEFLESKAH